MPVLKARAIAKSFGATQALRKVDLTIRSGEVHALLGGNGAGKTTLVKILLGALQPSEGHLEIDGSETVFPSVRHAISRGIFPIYQHLSQFPDLTVRENLAAFSLGMAHGLLARPAMPSDQEMRSWLAEVGLSIGLDTVCRDLSVGERQLLEIARAIAQDARVLVLDEPTAALTHAESEVLMRTVRRLRENGVGMVFISHKLDEVVAIADRVTVIRDGICAIEGVPSSSLTTEDIVLAMVGREMSAKTEIAPHRKATVASITNLKIREGRAPVSFEVARGEVVGLAGIVGSGMDRIAAAIAGAEVPLAGSVAIDGITVQPGHRRDAVNHGIGFVPTDRHEDGIFDVLGVLPNTSAASLRHVVRRGMIQRPQEQVRAHGILERIGLHPFRLDFEAADFSGGNQQKLVVARNLLIEGLKLLVMSEPTRGVDVAARQAIHEAILAVTSSGVAVIIASSDIDELLDVCHRVLIIQDYTISGMFERGAARQEIVGALAGAAA